MIETYDRFKISNLIRLAKTTSDEALKEKYLEQAYQELESLDKKMQNHKKESENPESDPIRFGQMLPGEKKIRECSERGRTIIEPHFKYVYEAEPLDDYGWNLIIDSAEWLKHLYQMDLSDSKRYEECFDKEYPEELKVGILYEKKINAIREMMHEIYGELRTETIGVYPISIGHDVVPVFVAKADNNGTTCYFSETDIGGPGIRLFID